MLAYDLGSAYVPSFPCDIDLLDVSSSSSSLDNTPSLVTSSNDNIDDENPLPPALVPLGAPQIPQRVHSTHQAVSDIVGDPRNQQWTCSHFYRASSLLDQVLYSYDPDTFVESFIHPEWDTMMNEDYFSLLANDTWDISHLLKGTKIVIYKWVCRTK